MKFEYEGAPRGRPGAAPGWPVIRKPMIEVRVIGPAGSEARRGRLDTGSDETILTHDLVRRLGIELEEGKPLVLRGIADIPCLFRRGRVILELRKRNQVIRWIASVGFWIDNQNHRTLFGLTGFLEYFSARFNGEHEHVDLLPNRNLPSTTAATP